MSRRRWRAKQPGSMQEAIRLCLDWALHKHNRSVAQIAELIGTSEWAIYGWMREGSIPSIRIRPFEFACDAHYVTRYLAASAGKLTLDIPAGGRVDQDDLLDLQNVMNDAVGLLTRFYREHAEAEDVLHGVTIALEQLAGHRENVRKADSPELALFDGGEG